MDSADHTQMTDPLVVLPRPDPEMTPIPKALVASLFSFEADTKINCKGPWRHHTHKSLGRKANIKLSRTKSYPATIL